MSDTQINFDQFMQTVDEKIKDFENKISALQVENLYLREIINHKIKQCEDTIGKANNDVSDKMNALQNIIGNKPVEQDNLFGYVLVGFESGGAPRFCRKHNKPVTLLGAFGQNYADSLIILESLPLVGVNVLDLKHLLYVNIQYKHNIIYKTGNYDDLGVLMQPGIFVNNLHTMGWLKSICKIIYELGITIIINGQYAIDGIQIDTLVERMHGVRTAPVVGKIRGR